MITTLFLSLTILAAPTCRKACLPDEQRGPGGCCIAAPRAATGAATNGPSSAGCPSGQEISEDSAGHCCWPGQAWHGERCIGLPTRCPAGYLADKPSQSCAAPPCA